MQASSTSVQRKGEAATGQAYTSFLPALCAHVGLPVLHIHLAPLLLLQGAAVLGIQDGSIGAAQGQLVLQLAGRAVDVQWVIGKLLQVQGERRHRQEPA